MRGYYQVTVKSDHEVWQLAYTDGSLGAPQIIPNDSNLLEECSRCQRKWSHQDTGLHYDFESGLMICPMCQEKELQSLLSVDPAHLTDGGGQARLPVEGTGRRETMTNPIEKFAMDNVTNAYQTVQEHADGRDREIYTGHLECMAKRILNETLSTAQLDSIGRAAESIGEQFSVRS